MSSDHSSVVELWTALLAEMENLEGNVQKNTLKKNVAAGVRVRKGLRVVRKLASEMLRTSLSTDKSLVAERKTARQK